MSLLSDRDILDQVKNGRVVLRPWRPDCLQPASVDVHLAEDVRVFDSHRYSHIDPVNAQPDLTRVVEVAFGESFTLHPGQFVLASTLEALTLPDDVAARLEGKSSLGRIGLLTHATAGFIDPGFDGQITLELSNAATLPLVLYPGMPIGQLCFVALTSPAQRPYGSPGLGSHYQGQRGPTPGRPLNS